ncbi:hypothetical protein HDU92_000329, partial [Lobulomyces angularis]
MFFDILDDKIKLPYKKLKAYNSGPTVLIGVSGCGKTATCYHLCRTRFALYFDCYASNNMKSLLQKIADIAPAKKSAETQDDFEYKTQHYINCLLLSRLLVLDFLLFKDPLLSSLDWLKYQLSSKTEATFENIFDQLVDIDRSEIFDNLRVLLKDRLIIFDECQYLLKELPEDFCSVGSRNQIVNNTFIQPLPFFSFLARYLFHYETIWCGTHRDIRFMQEFWSSAGGKPSEILVFTDFTYMKAEDVKQLLKECLVSDVEISLEQELCHFLQGRPRFFTSFLTRLMMNKEHKKNFNEVIKDVFKIYRNSLTNAENKKENESIYKYWEDHFYSTVTKLNRGDKTLKTAKLTNDILLNLCLHSLFSKSNYLECSTGEVDMVSTGLVMIEKYESEFRCYMAEPMTILAGLNCFNNNTHRDAMMEYLCNLLFDHYDRCLNPPPQPRGLLMELVVALQFLRGWWLQKDMEKKYIFESYLPKKCFSIQPPIGVVNCRNATDNHFFTSLQKPGDSKYLILSSTAAGPDISYFLFHCNVNSTWKFNYMSVEESDERENILNSRTPVS